MEKIWSESIKEQLYGVEAFLVSASSIVGINKPNFIYIDNKMAYDVTGGGLTIPGTIFMFKISLITLLHEFRHQMQYQIGDLISLYNNDVEEDARAWSCSLYYQTDPKRYAKAVGKGLLYFN